VNRHDLNAGSSELLSFYPVQVTQFTAVGSESKLSPISDKRTMKNQGLSSEVTFLVRFYQKEILPLRTRTV
jgi:hypothetical protein